MSKIQISKYGTQSVNVADILSEDDAMHQIEEIAKARLAEQAEIAALREKLKWRERLEELELEGIAAFLDGKPSDSHGLADAGEQAAWLAGYESQQELTALREKLAAAEASLAERGRMLELANRVQREYRAVVAAALAELRTHWNAQYQDYVSKTDDSSWERRQELLDRMRELDATIAKLDLVESKEPPACTWTPDDDGNYATGCDGLFVILEGTPKENNMAFCCYCGKPIKEQPK